jgi:hypothetical protein
MDEAIDVDIFFTCIVQPKRELLGESSSVIQLAGRPTKVSVARVPEAKLPGGIPSAGVIWQAEAIFLERQEDLYPAHHVISWEAHSGNPAGPVLSRFRLLIPAQDV